MSVLLLDPRQPTLIPLELVVHLRGSVEYTEEVPIRVRWAIADLGADVVDGAPVLVSTERRSDEVQNRLAAGEELIELSSYFISDEAPQIEVESTNRSSIEEAIRVIRDAVRLGQWESEQTHRTLLPFLREELEEYAEAVDEWEANELGAEDQLKLELSDLLLQVLFHAQVAQNRGSFNIYDVAQAFVDKMRSRQPYLFDGSVGVVPVDEQKRLWQEGKEQEKVEQQERTSELQRNFSGGGGAAELEE